jgi:hypothetical protein
MENGTHVTWMTADRIKEAFEGYMPKKLLDEFTRPGAEHQIQTMDARRLGASRTVYRYSDVQRLDVEAPTINPDRLFVDETDTKWISPEGCVKLVAKIVPHIDQEDIRDIVAEYEQQTQPLQYQYAKVRIDFGSVRERHGYTELYKLDEIVERVVPFVRQLYGKD